MEKLQPTLRFPEFKGDWKKDIIDNVSEISSGGTPSRANAEYWNGEIPWVSTTLIDFNTISSTDEHITELGLKNSSAKLFPKGTILMAMYGQGKTRGKVGVLGIEATTNQACGAIISNSNIINNIFLFHNLSKRYDEIRDLSNQGGQENLSGGIIKALNITFPSIAEQTKIATFLSAVDEKLNLLKEKKALLKDYKKGMMQKIFSQELRFKDENEKEFADWEEKKLGEICEVNKGSQLNRDLLNDNDLFPCISGGIEPSGFTNEYNRPENTIIISEGGNSCGFVNFITTKFWCGGHCYSIDLKNDSIQNSFLFQLLKFNQLEIMKLRVGSGLPNIQKKDLLKFNLLISSDLEEQTKIATFLSAIDEKIELVTQQIEDTQEYKKGLLQQMFC